MLRLFLLAIHDLYVNYHRPCQNVELARELDYTACIILLAEGVTDLLVTDISG